MAPKGTTFIFPDFLVFLVTLTFLSSGFQGYEHLPSEGDQNYRLCLAHPLPHSNNNKAQGNKTQEQTTQKNTTRENTMKNNKT